MYRTFGPLELRCVAYPGRCPGLGCFVPDGTCILDQFCYNNTYHGILQHFKQATNVSSPALAEGIEPNGLKHLRPGQRPG